MYHEGRRKVSAAKCLHLYHYLLHPTFGLCHVRVQTWLPFTVEVWINGREWLAQQMDAAGLAYVKRENFFPALADPNAAQALFDEQPRIDWPKQLGACSMPPIRCTRRLPRRCGASPIIGAWRPTRVICKRWRPPLPVDRWVRWPPH